MNKAQVRKRYPRAVCINALQGWAIYSTKWGYRITGWYPTQKGAWQRVARRLSESIREERRKC